MASEKSLQILESIKALTILELADLVKAVEEEFGMRFKMKEVSAMKDVGEMMSIIAERATR